MDVMAKQYDWIKVTRQSLFRYCETLTLEDYLKEHEGFGGWSIRYLHVHVANCYEGWLRSEGLNEEPQFVAPDSVSQVQEMRTVFDRVDGLVEQFLRRYEGKWDTILPRKIEENDEVEELTPLWLLTHTMTHEFHHKGQIVSMSRQMGYVPEDTDLISPLDVKKFL
ncbi:MAG TPA: DinB family protein [Bacillales bacterium]|nr:DinB family protein [Bacillales bacterium]